MGPKKGLALLLSPDKGDEEEAPASSKGDESDYDDAVADVADVLDVPEEKRKTLGLALRRLVMCCDEGEG